MDRNPKASDLDPEDWREVEAAWHWAVDTGLAHFRTLREPPVWRPTPERVLAALRTPLPEEPTPIGRILEQFRDDLLPFNNGNAHPSFFGWVHGGGNIYGAIGEMCAAIMNSNVGGRDHVAVHVERQVLQWCRDMFGFAGDSSGLLTSGTSMSTLIALNVARNRACGTDVDINAYGLQAMDRPLVGYCSEQTHSCVRKAFQVLGLGSQALRSVRVKNDFSLDIEELEEMVDADRQRGLRPFCVIATAGTVNTGAIDDIAGAVAFCEKHALWLHVDAAFGGFAILLEEYRNKLARIACADSVAFDFHKWPQVPYAVGGLLIADAAAHRRTFSGRREYLTTAEQGLAGGAPWFCDFGPELSRGFLALKVWFTLKSVGSRRLAAVLRKHCELARYLARKVTMHPKLELMAPVELNIVVFRFRTASMDADAINKTIVTQLHVSGKAAPSTTVINGHWCIRTAIVNHRTQINDMDALLEDVIAAGEKSTC